MGEPVISKSSLSRSASYWRKRRDDAIARAAQAQSEACCIAFLDLAQHYSKMIELADAPSAARRQLPDRKGQ